MNYIYGNSDLFSKFLTMFKLSWNHVQNLFNKKNYNIVNMKCIKTKLLFFNIKFVK